MKKYSCSVWPVATNSSGGTQQPLLTLFLYVSVLYMTLKPSCCPREVESSAGIPPCALWSYCLGTFCQVACKEWEAKKRKKKQQEPQTRSKADSLAIGENNTVILLRCIALGTSSLACCEWFCWAHVTSNTVFGCRLYNVIFRMTRKVVSNGLVI